MNLAKYDEWHDNRTFIQDIMRFLDNVMDDFITRAPETMDSGNILPLEKEVLDLE